MEDGVFPSQQSLGYQSEIEEERRLAYVAITRAKTQLIVVFAKERMIHGMTQRNPLSRFIKEIDERYLDMQRIVRKQFNSFSQPRPESFRSFSEFTAPKKNTAPGVLYSAGDRVNHITFGDGTILSVSSTNSDNLYEIAFDRVGTKKLMASYASKLLKKI
jgi:DNA helicase-2/ATP-dependent DNA helicase PcrA